MKFSWTKNSSQDGTQKNDVHESSKQSVRDSTVSANPETIFRIGINDFERGVLVKELRDARNNLIEEFPFSQYPSTLAFSVYSATTQFDFAISLFSNLSTKVGATEMSGTIQVLRATEDRVLEKIGTAISKEELKGYKTSGIILMTTKAQLIALATKISEAQMQKARGIFSFLEERVSQMEKQTRKKNSDQLREIYKATLSGLKKAKKAVGSKKVEKLSHNERLGIFSQLLEFNIFLSDPSVLQNGNSMFNVPTSQEIEEICAFLYR